MWLFGKKKLKCKNENELPASEDMKAKLSGLIENDRKEKEVENIRDNNISAPQQCRKDFPEMENEIQEKLSSNVAGIMEAEEIQGSDELGGGQAEPQIQKSQDQERLWEKIEYRFRVQGIIDKEDIRKLHAAGCHTYDIEINRMYDEVNIGKAVRRLRINFARTRCVDKKAVEQLHAVGCHTYDSEIKRMEKKAYGGGM